MFTDVEFMTAKEKEQVLKNWKRFLTNGLKKEHFTKRLYNHLHLHCGFIAHYNIHGFYDEYFLSGQATERFFKHLINYRIIYEGDYGDLNKAMLEVYYQHKDKIIAQTNKDIADKLNILEASILKAKQDPAFARDFLSRLNL